MTNEKLEKANELLKKIDTAKDIVNYFSEAARTGMIIDSINRQETGFDYCNDDMNISKKISDLVVEEFQRKLDTLQKEFDNL